MRGKLYGIGVGPGDPELLTLKAVRLIKECGRLLAPGIPFTESKAYQISLSAVPELKDRRVTGVKIPMTKDEACLEADYREAAGQIIGCLEAGEDVGYLTLGDAAVYSTYLPIHNMVKAAGYEAELVSGVTSFCAAAARLGVGLAERDQALHVLPASYPVREGLKLAGTKVLMKAGRQMKQVKEAVSGIMDERGLTPENLPWDISVVENCGLEGERVGFGLDGIREDAGYLTLTVLKDKVLRRGEDQTGWNWGDPRTVYVVGIGPGRPEGMTLEARRIVEACDCVVGYTVYAELLKASFPDKEFLTTPMTQEEKRCELAFLQALHGKKTVMACSGDAGIYGMAGLMFQILHKYPDCRVKVVPGVTAALAGGALLGAPLGHDFAVISLSDRLTSWEIIEKRLRTAAASGLVICIYNPCSKGRPDYLQRACGILLESLDRCTVCGIASRAGREGESVQVVSLGELERAQADMFSTIFIGNSQTRNIKGAMVTPRGYRMKDSCAPGQTEGNSCGEVESWN